MHWYTRKILNQQEEIIMLQIILTIILYLIMVVPVGIYVYHIAAGKHTFADPVFDRVDGVIYKISGIKPQNGMNWKNTLWLYLQQTA